MKIHAQPHSISVCVWDWETVKMTTSKKISLLLFFFADVNGCSNRQPASQRCFFLLTIRRSRKAARQCQQINIVEIKSRFLLVIGRCSWHSAPINAIHLTLCQMPTLNCRCEINGADAMAHECGQNWFDGCLRARASAQFHWKIFFGPSVFYMLDCWVQK